MQDTCKARGRTEQVRGKAGGPPAGCSPAARSIVFVKASKRPQTPRTQRSWPPARTCCRRHPPATLPPSRPPVPHTPSLCSPGPLQNLADTMSYEPSANGSVAASTAGSELDFGGENEAQYTLPSLTTLVRWVQPRCCGACW